MRLLSLLPILLAPTAFAAEVTDLPPALRGDVGIHYLGTIRSMGVEEGGEEYARLRDSNHGATWNLTFAPADGLAFVLAADSTFSHSLTWLSATSMVFDPVKQSGTYTLGAPIEAPQVKGSGLNGLWIGAALQPFNESWPRAQRATWRIDLAYRTGSKNTFWAETDGKRGSAPGGPAFRVVSAFSTDNGAANPYVQAAFQHEGRVTVDATDSAGTVVAPGLIVKPGTDLDLVGGVEVVGYRSETEGHRFAVDLRIGASYRSFRSLPSGLYLPSVLDASLPVGATQSDRLAVRRSKQPVTTAQLRTSRVLPSSSGLEHGLHGKPQPRRR